MAGPIDVDSYAFLIVAAVILAGTAFAVSVFAPGQGSSPEIIEGDFSISRGTLLSAANTCSSDSDCSQTTCHDGTFYEDTDGDRGCTTDSDGSQRCTGYDRAYSDAAYCGGRYDYNCDSSGCEGYKAACEDDCGANSGCDTYSFCSSESDEEDSADDSTDTSGDTGSTEPTCTDACTHLTKACSGNAVIQCQDTDSDSCTDGSVQLTVCDGSCTNAECVAPVPTDTTPSDEPEPTEPEAPARGGFFDGVVQAVNNVWNSFLGLFR